MRMFVSLSLSFSSSLLYMWNAVYSGSVRRQCTAACTIFHLLHHSPAHLTPQRGERVNCLPSVVAMREVLNERRWMEHP